jgi:hypothetical protein
MPNTSVKKKIRKRLPQHQLSESFTGNNPENRKEFIFHTGKILQDENQKVN